MWADRRQMKLMFRLSIPIVLSLLLQAIVLVVNAAMVGRLGVDALAGVGVAAFVYTFFTAVLFGIDAGVQAVVARRGGEGRHHLQGGIVTEAVVVSGLAGAALAVIAAFCGPMILAIVTSSPSVAEKGLEYLYAICPALVFVGANYAFNAYWNGTGQPRYTFLIALIQMPGSVIFSYVLIFGLAGFPALGVTGAGIGIVLAVIIALAANFLLALKYRPIADFMKTPLTFSSTKSVLGIGFPISLEQMTLHLGTVIFFWIAGLLGTNELAVANVIVWLDHLVILPAIGVGIIVATCVGSSLGARDAEGARRWGWEGAVLATIMISPVSFTLLLFPGDVLSLFIQDPDAYEVGIWPLRLLAISMLVNTFGRMAGYGLRGAGATKSAALVNFGMNWCANLPAAWVLGIALGYGLMGIAAARLAVITVEAALLVFLWSRSYWTTIDIPLGATGAPTQPRLRKS